MRLQDAPGFRGHSPDQERVLGGYVVLMGAYVAATARFAAWFRSSGRELPERIDGRDLALAAVATHKVARLVTKDRITSAVRAPFTTFEEDAGPGEVSEAARGHGLRRAVGELLVCPYCLGMWTSTAFTAGFLTQPKLTRVVAGTFSCLFAADVLQIAYAKAEEAL